MNREEWNKLSEESKWRIYSNKYLDFLNNIEFKANTIINDTREESHNDFYDESILSWENKEREINNPYKKKDTREGNSDECYFNKNSEIWFYINPFDKRQDMYVQKYGFVVNSNYSGIASNKDVNVKSVWQKVESIEELKVGDYVRFYNGEWSKNKNWSKGIIVDIWYDLDRAYDIAVQRFRASDNSATNIRSFIDVIDFCFKKYKYVEKAVLVEE